MTAVQTLEAVYGLVQTMRVVMDGEKIQLGLSPDIEYSSV